ncbi:MAG: lipid asymmetry maintenance protein MlaB [Gammaproteobacteria bacterium]
MSTTGFRFVEEMPGRFVLSGEFGYATARRILEAGNAAFPAHESVVVDLSGVTQADSAGLAVLLEWVTWAHREGREIRFQQMPRAIRAIARISEVEGLLEPGEDFKRTVVIVRGQARH